MPQTGNQAAYRGAPDRPPGTGANLAAGSGRAVVLMFKARLCAPVLRLGMGLLVNAHAAAVGTPDVQDRDTLLGNAPVGVAVTV
jgi:hypothetical protein